MNESLAFAYLSAYALGTRSMSASPVWTGETKEELRELVRGGPLRDIPLAQLDPIMDRFRHAGDCPVSSAAKLASGGKKGIDWPDAGSEQILRAALPAELTELLRGTSRRVSLG